jgi:hypothetical protein
MKFVKLTRPDGAVVWVSENRMAVSNAASAGPGGSQIRLGDTLVQIVKESPEQVVALFRQLGLS